MVTVRCRAVLSCISTSIDRAATSLQSGLVVVQAVLYPPEAKAVLCLVWLVVVVIGSRPRQNIDSMLWTSHITPRRFDARSAVPQNFVDSLQTFPA